MLLFLSLCAACSSSPRIVAVPTVERVMPPSAPMQETARPAWNGRTNGELLEHALDLGAAVDRCNADKGALRAWKHHNAGPSRPEEHNGSGR